MFENKNVDFVARHYRKGCFSVERGWKSLGIDSVRVGQRFKAVAAIGVIVVLSVTATFVYNRYMAGPSVQPDEKTDELQQPLSEVVHVIDFEDASLPVVVDRIKDIYGVEIENLPVNAEDYKLSLRYEGTAEDLVATINEILGTEMIILWP